MSNFIKLDDSAFLLDAGALVTEMSAHKPVEDYGVEQTVNYESLKKSAKIYSWGKKNDLPQRREQLLHGNNIVPQLIATKRDITIGGGLMTYKYVFKDGIRKMEEVEMPTNIREFLDRIDIMYYLMNAAKNLLFHANVFTEFITTKDGKEIYSIKSLEARHVRAEVMNDQGKIPYYAWSGHWVVKKGSNKRAVDIRRIPAYDNMFDETFPKGKFVYHTGDDLLGDDYYYSPSWWGGENWIDLANVIPKFHKANIRNGYVIRLHIEYPKDYFDDSTLSRGTEVEKQKADEKRINNKTE